MFSVGMIHPVAIYRREGRWLLQSCDWKSHIFYDKYGESPCGIYIGKKKPWLPSAAHNLVYGVGAAIIAVGAYFFFG